LEALERRISDRGPQPEDLAALRRYYGDQPREHAALAMCELVSIPQKQSGRDQRAQTTDEKEFQKSILDTLRTEIKLQKNRGELAKGIYAIESASDVQEPPPPALDTLLRYRAANAREFKNLLNSLVSPREILRIPIA
jgi:hypothetical protein